VGVDLGTTNSAVATFEGGRAVLIPNSEGKNTTPSVVAFTEDGKTLVGTAAKRQSILNPKATFYSVKRFIGRKYAEVDAERAAVSFDVASDASGDAVFNCPRVQTEPIYPQEISAILLDTLFADAEAYLGGAVEKAVITVPAYFTEEQRVATEEAGKLARPGLVVRTMREPIAAALAYGLDKEEDELILVFDLGGGTFDISMLEVGGGIVEVRSTSGDARLGGDDFDTALVNCLAEMFDKANGLGERRSIRKSAIALQRLREAAEAAKIRLSSSSKVTLSLPFFYKSAEGPQDFKATITRNMFDKICVEDYRRIRAPVDEAMALAGIDLADIRADDLANQKKRGKRAAGRTKSKAALTEKIGIGKVVMVGGSTRIPAIQRFVRNVTGIEPQFPVNPDEAVALGAATQVRSAVGWAIASLGTSIGVIVSSSRMTAGCNSRWTNPRGGSDGCLSKQARKCPRPGYADEA